MYSPCNHTHDRNYSSTKKFDNPLKLGNDILPFIHKAYLKQLQLDWNPQPLSS